MNIAAPREKLLPTLKLSAENEWVPELLPRPDGIRFAQGIFLGVALSLPAWVIASWAVFSHF